MFIARVVKSSRYKAFGVSREKATLFLLKNFEVLCSGFDFPKWKAKLA